LIQERLYNSLIKSVLLVDGINNHNRKEITMSKKNYMFAEFKSQSEYQDAYRSVMNNTLKDDQFELVIFIERLRTTMLAERK
tara:strand:+ start:122 stop:367 length:246 start_codon:yes stop_codon:yes gene_type:complete